MASRYLLDEHVSPRVAIALSKCGVDARAVSGSRLEGSEDLDVLIAAIDEGRILVTYDIADFSVIVRDFLRDGRRIPGLILVDRATISPSDVKGLLSALVALARKIDAGDVDPSGGIFLDRA